MAVRACAQGRKSASIHLVEGRMRVDFTRRQFLGSTGMGLVAFGYGAGPVLAADEPKRGGVLTIGQDENPIGLDPHKTAAFSTGNIAEHIFTCLLRWDATATRVEPDLATAWENPDPQTFVFRLRDGVKFHNGATLTSDDVKFTFERLVDPATRSPWVSIFSVIREIETPNPKTVVFRLANPFSPFLNYLATIKYSAIVSREDVKQRGDLVKGGAGTGPFMLEDFRPNSLIRLKRNPDYYEPGLPYLDGLDFRIIPDEASRMAALRAGSVQLTWLGRPDSSTQMRDAPDIVAPEPKSYSRLLLLEFDQRKPPFNDVRVRRAFSMALNRELIIKVVWRGLAGLTASLPPMQTPFAVPSSDVLGLPYAREDIAAAKALMAEAGYAAGFETVFAVSPAGYGDVQIAQIIQQMVGRIGIRIRILQKEWSQLVADFQSTESPMSMAGLVWGPDPDTNISIRLDSKSTVNPGKTADPVLDDLLAKARQSYDAVERTRLYRAVQQRVADMAYVITPCAAPLRWEMWSNKLQGYRDLPSAQRVYLRQSWLQ
jgi:peptide/nickel transport system substrate-binding protein